MTKETMRLRAATFGFIAAAGIGALIGSCHTAMAACAEYRLPSAFSIKQSNGFALTIKVSGSGESFDGNATYHTGSDFRRVVGSIEGGSFDGRDLRFRVRWSGTGSGSYEGRVDKNGKLSGTTRGGGGSASFRGLQTFKCKT